ncbi:MAG: aldo/keto reductase [Kiloniellales bacterium]|nr:aldo/keto reductase [Kiloniellales bacterium]
MTEEASKLSRRAVLASLGAVGLAAGIVRGRAAARTRAADGPLTRPIPASGEALPVIGMGSWITFDVGADQDARDRRVEVLRAFFEAGGGMIDSSPMYGSSEEVIGHALARLKDGAPLFSATKVWTPSVRRGPDQMEASRRLWGIERFDLMQVHNLVEWEGHLETLKAWKAEGRVRYLGVTTSHGRRHAALERLMATEPLDFVQFTYNLIDREAERRLLPLAAERGLAVIVNRPFRRGALFDAYAGKPLPGWAAEIDCENWAQLFLKFVVSHPAVTCAIPATSRVDHMRENMGAAYGRLPDPKLRQRMIGYIQSL